jgi:hypothetical protein
MYSPALPNLGNLLCLNMSFLNPTVEDGKCMVMDTLAMSKMASFCIYPLLKPSQNTHLSPLFLMSFNTIDKKNIRSSVSRLVDRDRRDLTTTGQ